MAEGQRRRRNLPGDRRRRRHRAVRRRQPAAGTPAAAAVAQPTTRRRNEPVAGRLRRSGRQRNSRLRRRVRRNGGHRSERTGRTFPPRQRRLPRHHDQVARRPAGRSLRRNVAPAGAHRTVGIRKTGRIHAERAVRRTVPGYPPGIRLPLVPGSLDERGHLPADAGDRSDRHRADRIVHDDARRIDLRPDLRLRGGP